MTKLCIRSLVLLAGLVLVLSQGGFAQAAPSPEVGVWKLVIAEHPHWVNAYINLANVTDDPDEAIAAASHALSMPYKQATGAMDFRPLAYFALSFAYIQKGDIANALSQADAGLSRYPGSPALSRVKGEALIASGQYSRASEVLIPAFVSLTQTTNPDSFAAWGYVVDGEDSRLGFDAALSQYYAGQYPQALESARQFVVLGSVCANPEIVPGTSKSCTELTNIASIDGHDVSRLSNSNSAFQHFLKGPVGSVANVSYRDNKQIIEAKMVRQAVRLTKEDARYLGLFALILNANGNHEEALAMAQKAIDLDQDDFWAELSCGVVLEDLNRPDEALKALDFPTTPGIVPMMEALKQNLRQLHRAVLYARKGDMAKAQEIYDSVANHIDPRCLPAVKEKDVFALAKPMADAHLANAKQLDAQGKYAESLTEYAQALSYAPNEQEATMLRTAMFAASGKMPTPPEMPDDAHRHVVRGELMLKDGNLDRALVEFNEALRIAPYMPKLYYNTALICGELKQYDKAIRQMRLYLTLAPETPDARATQDQITKWEMRLEMEGNR